MITLKLTTPLMGAHNAKVREEVLALQNALIAHGYLHAPKDGVYGPMTAQAVYRAKYHLGYPKPDHASGEQFWNLLTGRDKPNKLFVALALKRRKAAEKKASQTPQRVQALNFLISKTGLKEHPAGSNRCVVSDWYGLIGPWCAMTGMWAFDHVGNKTFTRANGHKYGWAYVPNIVADARRGVHGLTLTHNPLPGHGVAYDWQSDKVADHWGTFERWINRGAGTFYAREGNTAVGNDSNGGELMQRERSTSLVQAFVVVKE